MRAWVKPFLDPQSLTKSPNVKTSHDDLRAKLFNVKAPYREGLALMARWRVDIIRKRSEHLGTVEAANEKEAIEKAAKEFNIPPERQNRLLAQKIAAKD
jgi:hypothetical protein